jgi:hypothetical protein
MTPVSASMQAAIVLTDEESKTDFQIALPEGVMPTERMFEEEMIRRRLLRTVDCRVFDLWLTGWFVPKIEPILEDPDDWKLSGDSDPNDSNANACRVVYAPDTDLGKRLPKALLALVAGYCRRQVQLYFQVFYKETVAPFQLYGGTFL